MPNASQISYVVRRYVNRWFWRPLQQVASVVHPMPVVSSILVWLLLAKVGQMHEVYITYLEAPDLTEKLGHILLAVAALAAASAAIFYSNHLLSAIRIDVIYAQSGDFTNERHLKMLRNSAGVILAAAPWLGVWFGTSTAARILEGNIASLRKSVEALPALAASADPVIAQMRGTPTRLFLASGIALIVGFVWLVFLHFTRQSPRVRGTVLAASAALVLLALVVPHVAAAAATRWPTLQLFDLVSYARAVGPLATMLAVVVVLIGGLALLAYLSGQVGFPLIPLVLSATLLGAMFGWPLQALFLAMLALFAFLTLAGLATRRWALSGLSFLLVLAMVIQARPWSVGGSGAGGFTANPNPPPALDAAFRDWMDARRADIERFKSEKGRRYPVFIVAAQGGGIYAASATAAFLSALQDRCPAFARHVFVISAVSGGAVGASAFQTMLQPPRDDSACRFLGDTSAGAGPLQVRTGRVMQDDHFSPLLGMMLLDLAGFDSDRAVALERSFERSVAMNGQPGNLAQAFDQHWTPRSMSPALLLNATWVETGYRVAYAPFALNGMRDKTFYGFSDPGLAAAYRPGITVAQAAMTSARFPGVLPARVAAVQTKNGLTRWNFVDGAYADGSGAASALEVYMAIEKLAAAEGVDLRLILLTSARRDQEFAEVKGVAARDILAPALAVLRVRDLLSQQAVMRALSEIEGAAQATGPSRAKTGNTGGWKAAVVELDQNAFTLPLSWEISRATHGIVSLAVASTGLCDHRSMVADPGDRSEIHSNDVSLPSIQANSCVLQSVLKLLDPTLQLD
ncbi:MAG: hypothetical protein EKK41_20970 [Hyphomicrobiales bacterium]|nr:MAG: hypothetical protein EKK41_20970 [Hyphomicrobiales bacterium]